MKSDIEQAGAQLVFVAAEKSTGFWKPAKFLQSHPVSFPFLLDEDRSVTKAYGLYDRLSMDAINIAHPATLVIDRDLDDSVHLSRGQSDGPGSDR